MTEPATTDPQTEIARVMNRIFTATLVIGVPGSGKTTLFKGFSEYLWETHKKVLLLYSWDGGAIPTDVQKRMKQGLIRYWRARTRSGPGLGLETMYLASRGYWPAKINAETGETSPAVQLVPPVTVKYHVTCSKGHGLCVVPAVSLITPMFCTPCGAFVQQNELRVREESARTKGFEAVGGVGFDGLTSMGDVVLDHMDIQRGEGLIGGEKSAFGGVVTSGQHKFGGNNRADVGFGQTRAHQFVNNSLSIPYLVEGPVFTALAMEATDEGGLPIVGAKLPGRAATDEASAWFGNVAETGKINDDQGRPCFALYLRPFVDPQGRRHLLKTSASPTGVPDKLVDPSQEANQPYTVVNLGSVFKMLDEDLRRSLLEELPGAPGIPNQIMEYGEPFTVEPAANGSAAPLPAAVTAAGPVPAAGPAMPVGGAPSTSAPIAAPNVPAAAGAPGLMVARPRARKGAPVLMPATMAPVETAAASAPPAVPPVAAAPAPVAAAPVTASPAAPVPAAAVPTGTTSPPPPGMRPPMKVPGSA
jgi:hypothetical protein